MATAAHPSRLGVRPGQRPRRTLRVSLTARLRGPWLDRELAAGVEPWRTPVHSARSLQITSARARRSLARSLEEIVARAELPLRTGTLTAQVPVDWRAVLAARPQLAAIAARLRDGAPVSTRGVAALRDVICDGAGPFYNPVCGEALGSVLAGIRASLDIRS